MRHGESNPLEAEQPLSEEGKQETKKVALAIKGENIRHIYHSVKLRAQQTAAIVKDISFPHIDLEEHQGLKPMDAISPLWEEIQSWQENILIVGHLPFLSHLFSYLLLGKEKEELIEFCGSSIACLEKKDRHYKLLWLVTPHLIAAAENQGIAKS